MKKSDRTTLNALAVLSNKEIKCENCKFFKTSLINSSLMYSTAMKMKLECKLKNKPTRVCGICNKFSF